MKLGVVIASAGIVMCSRQSGLNESVELTLQDSGGKLNVGSVVIVCKILAGLGDVGWTLNIASEVEKISNGKVTFVFWRKQGERYEDAVRFLERFREAEYIDSLDKLGGNGEGKTYIHSRDISNREINSLVERYDAVITFMVSRVPQKQSGDEWLDRRIIDIMDYGGVEKWKRWRGAVKIFFKDYDWLYGGGVNESEGYVKVRESPREFKRRVDGKQMGEFRLDYMSKVIPSGSYYFTYFSYGSRGPGKTSLLRFFCEQAHSFMSSGGMRCGTKTITILTNMEMGDDITVLDVGVKGVRVKAVHYSQLSPLEFEYALLGSGPVAGCTGNMSLCQVLSSGRVPIYECLKHNEKFLLHLIQRWDETSDDRDGEKRFSVVEEQKVGVSEWKVGYLKYHPGFWSDYRKFIEALKKDSFQEWFYSEVLLRVMMKFEGELSVDRELEERILSVHYDRYSLDLESMDGEAERVISELRRSGNNVGACLLEKRRIPEGVLGNMKILELRRSILEVIEKLHKMSGTKVATFGCKVIDVLNEHLRTIDVYEIRLGERLLK